MLTVFPGNIFCIFLLTVDNRIVSVAFLPSRDVSTEGEICQGYGDAAAFGRLLLFWDHREIVLQPHAAKLQGHGANVGRGGSAASAEVHHAEAVAKLNSIKRKGVSDNSLMCI